MTEPNTAQGPWNWGFSPSAVDWCEPNGVVTPYVAEFVNMATSFPMVLLGLTGFYLWMKTPGVREVRFAVCHLGLAMVGTGSMLFHGTLTRWGQALDELPMVLVGLVGVWIVAQRNRPGPGSRPLAVAFVLFGLLFTAAYATSGTYFYIFLATYSAAVAYIALKAMQLTWFRPHNTMAWWALTYAAVGFLGTLALFWIPERTLGCDHAFQSIYPHGFWHIGSGTGTYAWFLWAQADRAVAQNHEVAKRPGWFPYFDALRRPAVASEEEHIA